MATRVDRGKKVLHMMPDGGRDVFLEFLFSLVLGVLFQLVGNVFMNSLSAPTGIKSYPITLTFSVPLSP